MQTILSWLTSRPITCALSVALLATAVPSNVLGDSMLVAEYLLDEGSGIVAHDTSGNGRHGTLVVSGGAPTWGPGYLHFSGADDTVGCVEVSGFPNIADSMSVHVRFRLASTVPGSPRTSTLVSKWNPPSANCSWNLSVDSGTSSIAFEGDWRPHSDDTATARSPNNAVVAGQWHTAVGIFRANEANEIYLDGVLVGRKTHSQGSFRSTASALRIGNRYWNGSDWNPFAGDIDYVRIYLGVALPDTTPRISSSPTSLNFGDTLVQLTFDVWNGGGGTLNYQIGGLPLWVSSVNPTSGSSTGSANKTTHTVTIDRGKLLPGAPSATVTISSSQVNIDPQHLQLNAIGVWRTVQMEVNVAQTVRTIDSRFFGVNVAAWDSLLSDQQTLKLLNDELNLHALRFPGGSVSDEYDWKNNRNRKENKPYYSDFPAFAKLAQDTDADVVITVNYGSGSPEEAAAWVQEAKQYHFRKSYWEIGNECYGDWEYDINSPDHDPVLYATRAADYISQMKAADANIKVGIVVVSKYDNFGYLSQHHVLTCGEQSSDWTSVVLATMKDEVVRPDFVVYHRYPQKPGSESDAGLLDSTRTPTWQEVATELREKLACFYGSDGGNIEILCTENNSVPKNPGKQTTSIVNALYLADSIGNALRVPADKKLNRVIWWDLRNDPPPGEDLSDDRPFLYGWRHYGRYGMVGMVSGLNIRFPTFYAAKLLKSFLSGATGIISAQDPDPLLAAFAARRAEDLGANLMFINKSPNVVFDLSISLHGWQCSPKGKAYSYGMAEDFAAQVDINSPAANITTKDLYGAATIFHYTFPPYSITVLSLGQLRAIASSPATPGPQGSFEMNILGNLGDQVRVEASSDFQTWSPLETITLGGSAVPFSDQTSTNFVRRFYRGVWVSASP